MARARRKKRCKNGLRRDGKTCRKTKCRTYITQKGFCAKAGGWFSGGRRRSSGRRKKGSRGLTPKQRLYEKALYIVKTERALREGREPPRRVPLIGDDPRSVRNYGRADPEQVARYIDSLQRASFSAKQREGQSRWDPPEYSTHAVHEDFHFGVEGLGRGRGGGGRSRRQLSLF